MVSIINIISMSNPKISVICPVYNVEKYLHKCVDSILAQTFTDFELLLIDDGSSDNSGKICDEYVEKDSRVRVFHKKNGGVSSARNLGLENVFGEWIIFVDSDDMLYSNALLRCYNTALHHNVDVLQFSYNRRWIENQYDEKRTHVLSPIEYVKSEMINVCVWGTFIKNTIIKDNQLCFDENISLGEDQFFIFDVLNKCKRIIRICDILYYYRNNTTSATHNPRINDQIKTINRCKAYKISNPFSSAYLDNMIRSFIFELSKNPKVPILQIRKLYKDCNICNDNKNICTRVRLFFYTSRYSVLLAIMIMRLLEVVLVPMLNQVLYILKDSRKNKDNY